VSTPFRESKHDGHVTGISSIMQALLHAGGIQEHRSVERPWPRMQKGCRMLSALYPLRCIAQVPTSQVRSRAICQHSSPGKSTATPSAPPPSSAAPPSSKSTKPGRECANIPSDNSRRDPGREYDWHHESRGPKTDQKNETKRDRKSGRKRIQKSPKKTTPKTPHFCHISVFRFSAENVLS